MSLAGFFLSAISSVLMVMLLFLLFFMVDQFMDGRIKKKVHKWFDNKFGEQ